jgi:SAM-dependent methyltransferase
MRLSEILPEAIPGPAALLYSLGPGLLGRPAQRKIAELVDGALAAGAHTVVDLGCGPGWLAIEIARRRPALRVLAIDLSRTMVRIARHNARAMTNVEVRNEHGAHLSAPDASVDMVVSAESMHHWREPVAVLDELHRVLRPGGRAWIFDGRDDFTASDLAGWTLAGDRSPPRPAVAFMRRILHIHGFPPEMWETRIPELVRQSRFGSGTIEALGPYRRVVLARPP